jgi:hypothetical protein
MSVWLAIGFLVFALVAVAIAILITDIARGDLGGGRHTMARAGRLLVVATDPETRAGAQRWVDEQRAENAERQFFLLEDTEGEELHLAVEHATERYKPDAIVVARHEGESPAALTGLYGSLKEDARVPVDAIYVGAEGAA